MKIALKQYVKDMKGIWDEKPSINEMFNNRQIITYIPIANSFLNVESLSELIADYNSDIPMK